MIQVSSLPVSVANLMVITGPLTCSVPMSKKNRAKCTVHKHVKATREIDIFDTGHSQDKFIAQSEMLFSSFL